MMDVTDHFAPAVGLKHRHEEQVFKHREVPTGMKMHDVRTLTACDRSQTSRIPEESANVRGIDLVYRTIVARPEVRIIREDIVRQIPVLQQMGQQDCDAPNISSRGGHWRHHENLTK